MKRLALIGLALLTAGALVFVGGMAKADWQEDGKELLAQAGTHSFYNGWTRVDHFEEVHQAFQDPVHHLEVDMTWGSLEIKVADQGEETGLFYNEAYDKHENRLYGLVVDQKEGRVTIKDDFKGSFNNVGFNWDVNPVKTVLVLPAESVLEGLDVKLAAGDLAVQDLKVLKSNFQVSAGQMTLENTDLQNAIIDLDMGSLEVYGGLISDSDLTIDMGNLEVKKTDFDQNKVKVAMGSVEIDGTLTGRNAIEADMGSVRIDTALPRSEYDMDVTGDMSDIEVEGGAQGGNRESGHVIQVRVNMGDVKIHFAR